MKQTRKRIALLVILTMLAPALLSLIPSVDALTARQVWAASKASLTSTSYMVGVNSTPEYISITDSEYNATYSYESANTSIAKIDPNGYITGAAKGKTTISVNETAGGVTTNIGKITVQVVTPKLSKSMSAGIGGGQYVPIQYRNTSASYKYTSSDKSIVTVDESGYLTGYKYGKAKIAVKETYKKKTTTVGTITVNIKPASLTGKQMTLGVNSTQNIVQISNYNSTARYKYTSSNTAVVKINKDGVMKGLKKGSATIRVQETYLNKTRKLGTVKVKVVGASVNESTKAIPIGINSAYSMLTYIAIKHPNYDATYTCLSADNNIVAVEDSTDSYGSRDYLLRGVTCGATTLTVYEEYKGTVTEIGTVKATVMEIPIKNFFLDTFGMEEVNGGYTKTFNLKDNYSYTINDLIVKNPFNTTTPVTWTSSNENVIKIDQSGSLTLTGKGTTTINITCGNCTLSLNAVVE